VISDDLRLARPMPPDAGVAAWQENAPGREDAMHWDVWYDLAVLEMSELSEKLVEAEKAQALSEPDAEEPSAPTSERPA
jgi:hypothetical protein